MAQRQFDAFIDQMPLQDDGSIRAEVWSVFMRDCVRRDSESVSREAVLRELLDAAHARIRSLEAALYRLHAQATPDELPREESAG